MESEFRSGKLEGLSAAARICEETAALLDRASHECDEEGCPDLSELTGVGAVYLRHAAARIRLAQDDPAAA
jgi:hypothetical protein